MKMITLDVSPAIINRTAVYHMIMDLGERLSADFNTELSVVGKNIGCNQSPAFIHSLNSKKRKSLEKLISNHINKSRFRLLDDFQFNFPVRNETIRLFFDVLYVPFGRLSSRDFVVVHDLTTITFPDWHGERVSNAYCKAFRRVSASGCQIISDSNSTTNELRYHLGISHDRIHTIPLYLRRRLSNAASKPSLGVNEKFFLFVGNLEKRKNIIGLIHGFERTGLVHQGYSLKIVGMDGSGANEIKELSSKIVGVELLGFLEDETLEWLYANCRAFIYPSFWEGFGMPLLEAMSWGCVCISTESGASPEVGGNTVIYVDPCSIDSISAGILRSEKMSLADRTRIKELARLRAKNFNFEKYYKKFRDLIVSGFQS